MRFYSGRFLEEETDGERLDEIESKQLRTDISLVLAESILSEVEPLIDQASQSFRDTASQLITSLRSHG